MSITIQLMTNNSDDNVLSKNLTTLSSLNGTLKEQTSILAPVIKIDGDIPLSCNYMYIPDFNRYYFIDNISSVTSKIFEISGHVDVLKTYENEIRGCTGIIARQENTWNLYIDDGAFKTYQNEIIKLSTFPNGFDTQEFVLAVAGS